jgi:hypothetical protein
LKLTNVTINMKYIEKGTNRGRLLMSMLAACIANLKNTCLLIVKGENS